MGWLKDLDVAIQARLEAIEVEGGRALRTIGPLRGQGRSSLPTEAMAADKPAFFYAIERIGGDSDGALASVQALLIAEDLRGATAAWRGSREARGAYELAEMAAQAMAAPDLAGSAGAWLNRQRLACADGRVIALLQEYDVPASGERILVDGQEILAGRSILQLTQASQAARWQAERPVGGEACWAKWQGREPSRIALAGTLWAGSEAGLAAMEQSLASLLVDRRLHDLSLGSGGSWPDVALVSWQRSGGRLARPMLGLLGQSVNIEFEQYPQ